MYFDQTNQAVLEGVVADWSEAPPDICLISSEGHPVYTQVLEIAFLAAKQLAKLPYIFSPSRGLSLDFILASSLLCYNRPR